MLKISARRWSLHPENRQREFAEELAPAIAEASAALRQAEHRLKTLEAGSGKNQSSSTELREAAREVSERRKAVPATPKFVCSDVTPEELVRQLEAQGGSIAQIDAEGCGPFGIILGRYSRDKLPQVDVFLRAHAGDHIRVDRVGRESSSVRNPALTIGITAQPALLEQLNAYPQLRGLGLLARFLWAIPVSTVGTRKVRPSPVPPDVQRDYARAVRTLLTLKRAQAGEVHVLRLSADADDVLAAFQEQLEPRLGRGGDLEPIVDWASKLSGAIVRIAGLLHALDFLESVEMHPISAETLCNAIAIGDYLLAHAKVALSETTSDSTSRYASSILAWLQRRGLREFSKRDCHTELRSRFERAVHIDEPLRLLQARGWIAPIEMASRGGAAGRPPSPRFVVNPLARHSQNAQKGHHW